MCININSFTYHLHVYSHCMYMHVGDWFVWPRVMYRIGASSLYLLLCLSSSLSPHSYLLIHVRCTCTYYIHTCTLYAYVCRSLIIPLSRWLWCESVVYMQYLIPTLLESCTLVSFMYVHVQLYVQCTCFSPSPHLSLPLSIALSSSLLLTLIHMGCTCTYVTVWENPAYL